MIKTPPPHPRKKKISHLETPLNHIKIAKANKQFFVCACSQFNPFNAKDVYISSSVNVMPILTTFLVSDGDVLPIFLIEKMNQNKRGQRH